MRPSFLLAFVLPVLLLVAPATAAAVTEPFVTEGADTVPASDAISSSSHVAVVWPETAGDLTLIIGANAGTRTWTITVAAGSLPGNITGDCSSAGMTITCVAPTAPEFAAGLELWTGDGSDDVTVTPAITQPVVAFLRNVGTVQTFRGGAGNDVVDTQEDDNGDGGVNYLFGGRGDDGYVPAIAAATLDYVSFDDGRPAEAHTLSLDCADNDGSNVSGEDENIGCKAQGMDGVIGSDGDDMISNNPGGVVVSGGDGNDTLDGGNGVDRVYGGNGNDSVSAGDAADQLWGDRSFLLDDGATGDGNDTVNAVDADDADTVESCGGGTDTAIVDDLVAEISSTAALDCETKDTGGGGGITDSDGHIALFTFGTLPLRVIFDPSATIAPIDVHVTGNDATNEWTITYSDNAPVTPEGPECVATGGAPAGNLRAVCSVSNSEFDAGMEVWLGGGDSTFSANPNTVLKPLLIHPEGGSNVVVGGSGNDTIDASQFSNPAATNKMNGGLGADTFIGGAGTDLVDYLHHVDSGSLTGTQEFRLSLDCVANDGYLGDGNRGDDIGGQCNSIEGVIGSNSRDVITGSAGDDQIFGENGNDLIDGAGGDDQLYGQGDHDHLTGGPGADRTYGDYGPTTYTSGPAPDGSDTLIVNDGVADIANDCGGAEDAITYDAGLDTSINCENLTPPASTGGGTGGGGGGTPPPSPTKPVAPPGWTAGAPRAPQTREYTFPAAFTKEGTTFEAVLFGLAFAKPEPPEMEITVKRIGFDQLPDKWQDDDVVPMQFVGAKILRGAKPGTTNTIVSVEGQQQPKVELQYYDPEIGAPRNSGCPANGLVKGDGGTTYNLFRYAEALPYDDAVRELASRGCRLDGKPTVVRRPNISVAGVEAVRSTKVGKQRVVTFTHVVPKQEELRIVVAPDYTLGGRALTLAVDGDKPLKSASRLGLTATSDTQLLGIHVIESTSCRLVPDVRVDLVDEDGKVINWKDVTIAKPTKPKRPIGYADQHMLTNDVGFTRLAFRTPKAGKVRIHAYIEGPAGPIYERWLTVDVYNRTSLRTLTGTLWQRTVSSPTVDWVIAKQQDGATSRAAQQRATGIGFIDAIIDAIASLGRAPAGSPVATGAPGVVKAAAEAERSLNAKAPAHLQLAQLASASSAAKVGFLDTGGSTLKLDPKGVKLVAAGGGNVVSTGGGGLVAAGGGNLVGMDGSTLKDHGMPLVAAGGGNLVAAGGGNLVAAGGGNLVAAGGGNLVGNDGSTKLKPGRAATNNKGTVAPSGAGLHVIWIDGAPVLVDGSNQVEPGTIVNTDGRGCPVNYPGIG